MASIPNSGYSSTSTFFILSWARIAAAPRSAKIKAAVFLTGVGHLFCAVSLGDHDQGAAMRLEQVHIGIHAAGVVGPNEPEGIPLGVLAGPA